MDGDLAGRIIFEIEASGRVEASLKLSAKRTVRTNRAGFTLLHPIRNIAGSPVLVGHSDGSSEQTAFPLGISPSQPVFDIRTLEHRVGNVIVHITFDGETFEMEDQRNWTDASYKTYCRPLALPFPYEITAGETVNQSIVIELREAAVASDHGASAKHTAAVAGHAPHVLMALEEGWWPGMVAVAATETGFRNFLIRLGKVTDEIPSWVTEAAATLPPEGELDLEVVVPQAEPLEAYLRRVSMALGAAGVAPRRVMVLPEAYLKSYQPDADWPTGDTPADAASSARRAFPDAEIGVGVLTNFTELNRCRPDVPLGDFVTHGTTAVVHAVDDLSVVQTLEALADIYSSTRAFAGSLSYRLGLCSIGMRDNPYGASVAENPDDNRIAMARYDPRHKALFGAAFAVGVAAAAAGSGVQAFAPAGIDGPFGLGSFDGGTFQPYPIFHVVRALTRLQGLPLVPTPALPDGVHGLAVRHAGGNALLLANCGFEPKEIAFGERVPVHRLDSSTVRTSATQINWLDTASGPVRSLQMDPFSVAFCNLPQPSGGRSQ
ncbi:MAG: D-apionate lactonase [Alphaproteobacteria bacterium]